MINISSYQLSKGVSLICDLVLQNAEPSVTFSSLPQNFSHLMLVISAGNDSGEGAFVVVTVNGDNGANYSTATIWNESGTLVPSSGVNQNFWSIGACTGGSTNGSTTQVIFASYAVSSNNKSFSSVCVYADSTSCSNIQAGGIIPGNTKPITSITISCTNFTPGSTFSLYGLS